MQKMRILMCCVVSLMAGFFGASAAAAQSSLSQVIIEFSVTDPESEPHEAVTYSFDQLIVDNSGNISIKSAKYLGGTLPEVGEDGFTCNMADGVVLDGAACKARIQQCDGELSGTVCTGTVVLPEVCDAGTALVDGKCKVTAQACGQNTTLIGGVCLPGSGVCGSGTTFNGATFTCTAESGGGSPDPVDPDPVDPDPVDPDPVDPGNCSFPEGVKPGVNMNLDDGSQTNQVIAGNTHIASRFVTSSSSKAVGYSISFASHTEALGKNRDVWVSSCPGGPALTGTACSRSFTESVSLKLSINAAPSGYCRLEPGKIYYLNVKPTNCTGTSGNHCGFFRNIR